MSRTRLDAAFVEDKRSLDSWHDWSDDPEEHEVRATAPEHDPEVFKKNLRVLWQRSGLTGAQVVRKIGGRVRADWFRHLLVNGLKRVPQRTEGRLTSLAKLFDLKSIEDFWIPDLVGVVVATTGSLSTDNSATRQAWERDRFWPRMAKYKELLQSGHYAFLEELIDRLHAEYRREISEERRSRQEYDDGDEASDDDLEVHRQFGKRLR